MSTIHTVNATHDPALRSRVASANEPGTDFPIQNLPYGVFQRRGDDTPPRVGVAIGELVLDVWRSYELGFLEGDRVGEAAFACRWDSLNDLMALGYESWSALRAALSGLLREGSATLDGHEGDVLVPRREAELFLPAEIGDYTDFYCSLHHATNVGKMFRPDHPLLPNYKHLPIGYHGRASSIVISGTPVRRPSGQSRAEGDAAPSFGASNRLDYELEVGFFVGSGNELGRPIAIGEAERHLFGFCLVNDWSARDVQAWEYQPLGPFLSKSFATSISPWVVTAEALAPFRVPAFERAADDPEVLPYLDGELNRAHGGIDLELEVHLASAKMRGAGIAAVRLSRGNFRHMYWTPAQMLTHHASNGCNLVPGDLMASGTVSGPNKDSLGCFLELTRRGTEPIELPSGETRRFLDNGDEVVLRGRCERPGAVGIGFGECRGIVEPAL